MTTIETVLLVLLVADALALGALVLIQQGKGADVGAAFGAGSSNTMFGGGGSASFLVKVTSWLAVGFFVISFSLAYTAKERASTVRTDGVPTLVPGIPATVDEAPADVPPVSDLPLVDGPAADGPGDAPLTAPDESVDSELPDV